MKLEVSMGVRKILHLDLDAFFCACEELKDPSLAGKPFAVGGRAGHRGVIASCSYAARARGVRSAMPTARALSQCPDLILISGHHSDYGAASHRVMEIIGSYTPLVEQVSIDEAFLDVTDLPDEIEKIARELQARVAAETHLPCSLGGATNKLVAKIATDTGKSRNRVGKDYPRAILIVPPGQEEEFLAPLPVSAMWGIGPKTEAVLVGLGIRTLADLAAASPDFFERKFGKYGSDLLRHARGVDDRPVVVESEVKSISQETTFDQDTDSTDYLRLTLRDLSQKVAFRCRKGEVSGRVVRIKVRWSDFSTFTRQVSLPQPTDQDGVIFETAWTLFLENWDHDKKIRLIGVGVSSLAENTRQLSLFETPTEKEHRLLSALDEIHERYGRQILTSADKLSKKGK
jgi:DNA polymerase-4